MPPFRTRRTRFYSVHDVSRGPRGCSNLNHHDQNAARRCCSFCVLAYPHCDGWLGQRLLMVCNLRHASKGIALTATTGLLHGTPTAVSSTTLTFRVKDSAGHTASAKLLLKIDPALVIKPVTVPEAYVGSPYSVTFTATGGSGTGFSWSVASGTLPGGLALSSTGKISGQPTKAGSSAVSIEVKDS